MCGIAGIISKQNILDKTHISNMISSLDHRGPDENGVYNYENVSLGHARLSIIDLDSGKQPMISSCNNFVLSFNGEIYNYKKLKKELKFKGLDFSTNSDTEVVLKMFEYYGVDFVKRLRGMFAFAIFDKKRKEIHIYRDQLGIKPMYYYQDESLFIFSSEIRSIKQIPCLNLNKSISAIDHYLWLSYIPAPLTIFKNIKKLEPGHYISLNQSGKIIKHKKYWEIEYKSNLKLKRNEWLEILDDKLSESVKIHTQSDVPFGAFLSGGIDSSLVVAYMNKHLGNVNSFSISMDHSEYDELTWAKQAAKINDVDLTYEIANPQTLELLPKLVEHYGEPFGDSSAIPTYLVSKLASKKVKMVLSGDGGDESFMGYNRYLRFFNNISQHSQSNQNWKKKIHWIKNSIVKTQIHKYSYQPSFYNFYNKIDYFKESFRRKLWKRDFEINYELTMSHMDKYQFYFNYSNIDFNKTMNQGKYFDQKSYMVDDILTKVDIASMMNSLEVRTPFIDVEIFELAAKIPPSEHLNSKAGFEPKSLLKELALKYYPSNFVYRKKMGFGLPTEKWFDPKNGYLKKEINNILLDNNQPIYNYFKGKPIQKILNYEVSEKNTSNSNLIWLLLVLNEWLNQN